MGFANFTIIEIPEPPSIGCRSGYYTSDQVYTLKAKITPDETGLKSAVYSLNGADPVAMTTVEGQDYTHYCNADTSRNPQYCSDNCNG